MSIPAAYVSVIIIWATTPLAIKWSGEESGFLYGISTRMGAALVICLLLLAVLRRPLPWRNYAWQAYVSSSLGIFGAMSFVYWSAQYIPSGLLSVIFGSVPLVTSLLAAWWLEERALTPGKIVGMLVSMGGLALIFAQQIQLDGAAWKGLAGAFTAVVLHSISGILFKRCAVKLSPLQVTSGGLLVSMPLFALAWLLSGQSLPAGISPRGLLSIGYLALFGSVIGFMFYYYLLNHVAVSKVALITLITPVCALFIGQMLNNEVITPQIVLGTALVISGLSLHQWGDKLWPWSLSARSALPYMKKNKMFS